MRNHLLFCAALVACGGLIACDDDDDNDNPDNNGDQSDAEDRAIDQGNTRGDALKAQAQGEFQGTSEEDSIAKSADIVVTLNLGEIAQANLALSKATGADVRDLANHILADHQANNAALQAMIQNRGISPISNTVSATIKQEGDAALAQLRSDPPGDFDRDYVEVQISMHQEASLIVGNLRDYVDDDAMEKFLSDTKDAIEAHREHARDLLHDL